MQLQIDLTPTQTTDQEQLAQFACQLVVLGGRDRSIGPSRFRHFLEGIIALFPHNTLFLSLYIDNESGSQVYGRVHRMIDDSLLAQDEPSALTHLWAVWAEAKTGRGDFWSPGSAAAERVRHIFQRALDVG